ncbi:MAG: LysR family transcriptional regulator [Firmicutes bacterium]|nr:LysR family transcriptional regulator [Bacillota bacterium]
MDIVDLRYFVKVYENENLTKSAKELFITQQALSRIINDLEKEIGASLFNRNSRGVTPTELGEYIYPKAKSLIKRFDDFTDDIYNKIEVEKEQLKIGFSPGTLQILDARDVLEHSRTYLGIDINISEFSDIACEANVLDGGLDMAFTVNPGNDDDFLFYSLIKDNLVAVINKKNPLADKNSINFTDLEGESLILLDDTFRLQSVFREYFKKAGYEPDVYSRCNHDLNIAYDFVALNKGIFIFVNSLTHIKDYNEIVSIPIDVPTLFWEVGIIIKKGTKIEQGKKKFVNYFLKKYNKPTLE